MAMTSWNESSSTSTPQVINTPASNWLTDLSRMLGSLANQQYAWGQQQFAKLDSLTDAQIDNFLRLGDVGTQHAQGLLDRYNNLYGPQADQYARDAQTYASDERIQHQMGRAQAGAMQAGKQGLDNAERDLEAFGIDPSSGRYQDLVRASHTANAAAAAAAGEVERARVEQEGARRQENAMAYGQNIPSQAVNALNTAMQGVSGAMNAGLGRANAGVALTQSAAPYYNAAMSLKYPPVANNTQSSGSGGSNNDQGGGGGIGGGSARPSQRSGSPFPSQQMPQSGAGGFNAGGGMVSPRDTGGYANPLGDAGAYAGGGRGSMARVLEVPGYSNDLPRGEYDDANTYRFADMQWPDSGVDFMSQYAQQAGTQGYDADEAYARAQGNYNNYTDMSDPGVWANYQQPDYSDPYGGYGAGNEFAGGDYDYTTGQRYDEPYVDQNYQPQGGYSAEWGDAGQYDMSQPQPYVESSYGGGSWADYSGGSSPTNNDSWSNYSGGGDWGDWYARGGPVQQKPQRPGGYRGGNPGQIPDPMQMGGPGGGGHVDPRMSPSGGRNIDDVPAQVAQTGQPARLNADEFVIPRDVAMWKGQEFFQSLIKKSREARVGAPAKPSTKRPQGQNPGASNGRPMA
jgi:hypothetical protein